MEFLFSTRSYEIQLLKDEGYCAQQSHFIFKKQPCFERTKILLHTFSLLQEVRDFDDVALSISIRLSFHMYWNDS